MSHDSFIVEFFRKHPIDGELQNLKIGEAVITVTPTWGGYEVDVSEVQQFIINMYPPRPQGDKIKYEWRKKREV